MEQKSRNFVQSTVKKRRAVQVVSCPSAFPISEKKKIDSNNKRPFIRNDKKIPQQSHNNNNNNNNNKQNNESSIKLLDWHETAKEVRALGATAFERKQKRDYEDEQYFLLTGRHKKKHQVPLPIVRGIRKAAEKREAKKRQEAQQAGIVLPKKSTNAKKAGKSFQKYQQDGPAPNIGFTKNGVYRVSKDKLPRKK
ncbi:protein of unknown function DUF4602 containing protein [Nitzschia inconspicua]|uniref:Uncharacterized protein n=1 Tax=Nitzschia inconspicua TaxID=303405 RepID=A0A9K3M0T0_9STRA|nr:protein of unknown function DUF4602 containing protein [Nitzschia inconspicua]